MTGKRYLEMWKVDRYLNLFLLITFFFLIINFSLIVLTDVGRSNYMIILYSSCVYCISNLDVITSYLQDLIKVLILISRKKEHDKKSLYFGSSGDNYVIAIIFKTLWFAFFLSFFFLAWVLLDMKDCDNCNSTFQ